MPINPIQTRLFTDPIDPDLFLFVDFRYIDCYNGGNTVINLAKNNTQNVGDGIIVGTPIFDLEEGGSFYFGSGSGIDFGNNTLQLTIRNNFSISAYVKFGIASGFLGSAIFANSGSTNSPFQVGGDLYFPFVGPTTNRFYFGGSGAALQPTNATYSLDKWYHLVWTKQPTGGASEESHKYNFYLDGNLVQSFISTNIGTTSPNVSVGYDKGIASYFFGKIAQVKFWNKTLTPAQVIKEYSDSRIKLSSIGTKKVSKDIILYLNEKGTSAGWGDNSMYSNGARLLGGAQFNSGLILPGVEGFTSYAEGTLTVEPGQNFTISAWVQCYGNSSAPSTLQTVFSTGLVGPLFMNTGNPSLGLMFGLKEDNKTIFLLSDNIGSTLKISAVNIFQFNEIFHATVKVSTSAGVRTISIYKNGVLSTTNTINTGSYDWTNKGYRIGDWVPGYRHPFNGKIFNVTIHNRTLSDAEVQKLYAALPTSYKSNESTYNQEPTFGRILYVDGAEPSSYYLTGLTFSDISGSNRNGTLTQSSVTQGITTVAGTLPTFSQFNGGHFNFNGFKTSNSSNLDQKGNSFISFSPTNLPSGSEPSTIIAWARVKPSASGQYRYIFSYGTYNTTGQNRYVGIKYPTVLGQPGSFSIGGAGALATVLDVAGMVPDEWFQIAFVYSNSEMRLFVNGRLLNIKNQTLITNPPLRSAHIGRSNTDILTDTSTTDGYFYGDIAQVLVYNRALTEQEIYQHYKVTRDRFGAPIVERPTLVASISAPQVTTVSPSSITTTSALSGVIINFNGNSTITSSGILIRLKTQTGTFEFGGTGVTNIPGTNPITIPLSPSTNYEIRAYAYNGTFYGYGQEIDLTSSSPSVLTVIAVTASFTGNYATASGQVTDLGGNSSGYRTRGFVWSTSTINVANANSIPTRIEEIKDGAPFYTNTNEQWELRVEPLSQGTTYYLRSYARIDAGNNVYSSNELVFTTYIFPTLTVTIPTDINEITSVIAKIKGNVTGGNQPILQRGIVWIESPSTDPTLENGFRTTDGSGIGDFTGTLNGLLPGKTYYVKAYAISNAGVAYSSVASFTTDTTPAVTTVSMAYNNLYPFELVLGQPKQSATASGTITNIGGDTVTEVGILYSLSSTPFDVNTVGVGKVSLASGITNFGVTLSRLNLNTLYYYRAYAINSAGVGYGNILQFETLYSPNVVRPNTPNEVNNPSGSVTLRAYVNSTLFGNSDYYGQPVTVGFRYREQPSGSFIEQIVSTNYTLSTSQLTVPNNYFTLNLNLTPGKSYNVVAFAFNKGIIEGGTTYTIDIFNVPTLTTKTAITISFEGAQSGGIISNNGGTVVLSRGVVWTTDEFADPVYPTDSNIDLTGSGADYNAAITGLVEGTTYYYRAFARNSAGVGYGSTRTFTTTSRVAVVTVSSGSVTANSATLNGTTGVDLGGYVDIDEVGFYWSTLEENLPSQPAVGTTVTTAATKVPAGTDVQLGPFSLILSPLSPGVNYYFKAYTKNPAGTNIGIVRSFTTTSITRATVTIGTVGTITNTSIQINGSDVTNAGGGNVTVKGVVWSTAQNPVLGASNFTTNGSGLGSFNSSITGLLSGTIYYVRAYATNEAGTNYSPSQLAITTYLITTGTVQNSFSNKLDIISSSITWDTPAITARGVVWSINPSPILSVNNFTSNGTGVGTFNSPDVQILSASTLYYIRAYATTGGITYYGNQIQFTTPVNPTIVDLKLSSTTYKDSTKPIQSYNFYNSGDPLGAFSYQELLVSVSTGVSSLWNPGFVFSTSVSNINSLIVNAVNTFNILRTGASRLDSAGGTTFYAGPGQTNFQASFRPWYVRAYLYDGLTYVYSNVIREVNLPILQFSVTNTTTNTPTVTVTVNSMRPGTTPAINAVGYTLHPSIANQDVSGPVTNIIDTDTPILNGSFQFSQTINILPYIAPNTRYAILAWAEYTSVDGTIRIHTNAGIGTTPALPILGPLSSPTSVITSIDGLEGNGQAIFTFTVTNGVGFLYGVQQSLNSTFTPVESTTQFGPITTSSETVTSAGYGDFGEKRWYRGYVLKATDGSFTTTSSTKNIQFEDIKFVSFVYNAVNDSFVATIQFNATSGRTVDISILTKRGTNQDPSVSVVGFNQASVASGVSSTNTYTFTIPGSQQYPLGSGNPILSGESISGRVSVLVEGIRQFSFDLRSVTKP